jgi:dienelactone hydrolase
MKPLLAAVALTVTLAGLSAAPPSPGARSTPPAPPPDSRLGKPKDYNGYFPWKPPTKLSRWRERRQELREQILVANGLWPLHQKTPLHPVIHGKIDRDGYTVEKVFFASYPGFYVTGNLYRPRTADGNLPPGKFAGVLCPHGHWNNGRFYEASDKEVESQLKQGAEKTREGAKYHLQARCAQLARMGCVVFHYDMVGYADSTQIPHREGFTDAEAELRQQNFMGLQTWDSIRALDFLLSLPEVDPRRIGVTGASGGGTQTFILGAVDDRPAVAFPAVMVSTAMQGGCVCENCSYLRLNTSNVEIAGLFAPRPLAMSGADDWTLDIENDGLPELKRLYRLYGREYEVQAHCWPQFGHNYNQVSREFMYRWFNKHLKLGQGGPVRERPFVPVPPNELSVYDSEHPRPGDAVNAEGLRRYLTQESEKQLQALFPRDAKGLAEVRRVVGTALRVMVNDRLPSAKEVAAAKKETVGQTKFMVASSVIGRKGQGEAIPVALAKGPEFNGTVVVAVHPEGVHGLLAEKDTPAFADAITGKKAAVLVPDVFLTGAFVGARRVPLEKQPNPGFAGYNYGYNRTLLANRVHDILTAVAYARSLPGVKRVHLVGFGKAGPWVVLARALCGDAVDRTAADLNGFRFEQVKSTDDEMMQPGALKYGGLPVLAALCAPHELYLHNTQGTGGDRWVQSAYQLEGNPERLRRTEAKSSPEEVVNWMLR